jgi:signal peptidase I
VTTDALLTMADADKPRRPWVAAVLTVMTPGLGQLYAGRPARALLVWFLAVSGVVVGLIVGMQLPGRAQLIALAAVIVAVPVLTALDAARSARRADIPYHLRGYNRWYAYTVLALLSAYGWSPLFLNALNTHIAKAYQIPGGAMEPTLMTGDLILSVPLRGDVERAQIVVYRTDMGTFAKRVVGLPGDTIAMRDGQLLVGGRPVAEQYAHRESDDPTWPEFGWQKAHLLVRADSATYDPSVHNWGPLLIPADHYFLLGDNRNSSLDSRFIGFVHRDAIFARPTVVYFSRDPKTKDIQWARIGQPANRCCLR